MKWIKTRPKFIIEEAKIRDVILPKQAQEVRNVWGEKWLDLEEVDATEHIEQGTWKLDEEDKLAVFSIFFNSNMKEIYKLLSALPEKFSNVLRDSIDSEKIGNKSEVFDVSFDIRKATIDQMIFMYENVFKKISVSETKASKIILKDENGRPIMGDDNKIQKISKEAGAPIYSNNLVNINSFITDYNRCYAEEDQAPEDIFQSGHISRLVSYAKEDMGNSSYSYDTNIFGKDMHLQIEHNAKDILNISISKFFSSCQHLYTGGYRTQVLGNVFDTNSIPAFIKFDSAIKEGDKIISEFLPLSRVMVRSVEEFNSEDSKPLIFFDRTYPDRMETEMKRIIEKYTKNKATELRYDRLQYVYMPDIDPSEDESVLRQPYMDMLRNVKRAKFIGKNTRKLYLNKEYDWSEIKISPKAKITELIVETTDIPENTFDIDMDLEWVKFRYLKLKTISQFKIETDSYAFDKCSLDPTLFDDISKDIKKLQFLSCEITNLNLNNFENLDELQLIYTLDNNTDLKNLLSQTTVKRLEISGDLLSSKDNKSYIKSLKSNGVQVKIVGPVL